MCLYEACTPLLLCHPTSRRERVVRDPSQTRSKDRPTYRSGCFDGVCFARPPSYGEGAPPVATRVQQVGPADGTVVMRTPGDPPALPLLTRQAICSRCFR